MSAVMRTSSYILYVPWRKTNQRRKHILGKLVNLTLRGMERWAPPPESCQPRVPPYPPPELSFTVSWRGVGGQRRLSTPLIREVCGLAVSCPFPKNNNDNDGKGAMVPWTMRPIYSLVSYAFILQSSKKQGAAKPRRRSRPKRNKTKPEQRVKGKGQEGFLGCGCQVGIPTFKHSPSATTEKP